MQARSSGEAAAFNFGALALLGAIASILAAFGFQYIGGYIPCELCYLQRIPYYIAIPGVFATLVVLSAGYPRAAAALFFVVALVFLSNAGIGVYQAGAEWKFWPGPATCSGEQAISTKAGSLLNDLKTTNVVRCDVAQLRIFGLSFAGWNVVVSLVLFALALKAAFRSVQSKFS
ncbi:MAG: disulfide bond formation protein B [Hyphomicrobiaceae bacterium]|nr:disulfide bond formation protein B [Hyphomicrobiaceae bacterium]